MLSYSCLSENVPADAALMAYGTTSHLHVLTQNTTYRKPAVSLVGVGVAGDKSPHVFVEVTTYENVPSPLFANVKKLNWFNFLNNGFLVLQVLIKSMPGNV